MIAARRKLLFGLLAAPAIVRSASLMPLFVPPALILYGDGLHEDAKAVQFWFDGGRVVWRDRSKVGRHISGHRFRISETLVIPREGNLIVENCEFITSVQMSAFYSPLCGTLLR